MGGAGSLLIGLQLLPTIGFVLYIVGFLLLLLAAKYVSVIVGDKSIFRNTIVAVGLALIPVVLFMPVSTLISVTGLLPSANTAFFQASLPTYGNPNGDGKLSPNLQAESSYILQTIRLVASGVAVIISAFYLRRSLGSFSTGLKKDGFKTSAQIYVNGAITIWIGIGQYVMSLAAILLALTFMSVPKQLPADQESKPNFTNPRIDRVVQKLGSATRPMIVLIVGAVLLIALMPATGEQRVPSVSRYFPLVQYVVVDGTLILLFTEVASMGVREWSYPLVFLYRVDWQEAEKQKQHTGDNIRINTVPEVYDYPVKDIRVPSNWFNLDFSQGQSMFAVVGENRGDGPEARLDVSLEFVTSEIVKISVTNREKVKIRKGSNTPAKKINFSIKNLAPGEQQGVILIVNAGKIRKYKAKSSSSGKQVPVLYYKVLLDSSTSTE